MASPSRFTVVMNGRSHENHPMTLPFTTDDSPIRMTDLQKFPSFQENHSLRLNFTVDDSESHQWKLYVLGINDIAYQINNLEPNLDYKDADEHRTNGESCKYYFPVGLHTIYDSMSQHKAHVLENSPITPNVYTVKVTDGTDWYYSHFVISPKSLSFKEWSDMLNEIGQISHQLTVNHSSWESGFATKKGYNLSLNFADKLTRLAPRIRVSLHFILQGLRFDTRKHYRWVRTGREHNIDARTVRAMARFPANMGMVYAPYRYNDYNTGDNRWIKFMATRMLKWCNQALETYQQKELADHHQLLRLRNYLSYVLNMTILNNVNTYPPRYITKGLIYSPRYNQMFRLYQELINDTQQTLVVQPNQYRYKRTDKLYEFWIFIKIVQSLSYYSYHAISGWGCGSDKDTWLLYPDTRVVMAKKNSPIQLRVVYDDDMGDYSDEKDEPMMMFGTTHQRPDIRIDVFYNHTEYWGSLILDAKYKSLSNIVRNGSVNGQLTDYFLKCFSRRTHQHWLNKKTPCVIHVLAVYPNSASERARRPYSTQLFMLRQLGVNLEKLRPDNEMNLYEFANDIYVLLHRRIQQMSKLRTMQKVERHNQRTIKKGDY